MATTHYRKPMYMTQLSTVTLEANTLAVNTTLTIPANSITATSLATNAVTLGTASSGDTTSKLKSIYLSYNIDGAATQSVTHGVATTVKSWWVVNRTVGTISGNIIYCSDLDSSGTTLTLGVLGTSIFKVLAAY